jgi:ubiquinone/menaquinone biosynthesis C-methylase UbiE
MSGLKEDQVFDEVDSYDKMTKGKLSERVFHKMRFKQILTAASFKNKKVLDAGCGSGVVLIPLAEKHIDITGIDKSENTIEWAKKYCKSKGLKAKLFSGDIKKLPFKDSEFDIVILADVLEHITNPEHAVHEAERVCKSKGTIIVTLPTMIHKSTLVKKIFSSRSDLETFREYPIEPSKVVKMFDHSSLKKKNMFALFSEVRLIMHKN